MEWIKPQKLAAGDTVAAVSLSGGRAGDADMLARYALGKQRLEQIFGLRVAAPTHSLKGSDFLYRNPKARADDLMEALREPCIKGIFLSMGGDDGIRLLPHIDFTVIRQNPKVFIGFSDGDTFHRMFSYAGVVSFYGANLLATLAEPGELNSYTIQWIRKALFTSEAIGELTSCDAWTGINWNNSLQKREIPWEENAGHVLHQGKGKVRGHIMTACGGPLRSVMGTCLFPPPDMWENSIICLEEMEIYGSRLAAVHGMRALAAAGIFRQCGAVLLPRSDESFIRDVILKVLHEEGLFDLPVLSGVAFGHMNPMAVLPIGVAAEIDCDLRTFTVLESGVWD